VLIYGEGVKFVKGGMRDVKVKMVQEVFFLFIFGVIFYDNISIVFF
jgi:hypothetical protein